MSNTMMQRILAALEHTSDRLAAMQAREERARADSLARARVTEERVRYSRQQANQAEMVDLQAIADDALAPWSIRAPAPSADDTRRSYKIRLLDLAAKQLPPGDPLRRGDLRLLGNDVLDIFAPQIFEACKNAVNRTDTLAPGQEREIRQEKDGRRFSSFVSERSFVVGMMPEARRVVQFAKRDGTFREE
jgi:hypothetical protein